MGKVFVLGIDGGTLDLIEPWSKQGLLPNFRKLMQEGAFGTCISTIHPLTPQAWASFLTGKNPGKHGLFDFGVRKEGSYALRLTTSHDRKSPAIWNFVNACGMKTGIINVPLTYPPEKLDGFMISGMNSPSLEKAVFPQGMFHEIHGEFPDYQVDVMSQWYNDYDIFLEKIRSMTDTRARLGEYLYRKHRPELFVLVMVSADRVQHALWGQMAHPLNGKQQTGWKYSRAILNCYVQLDGCLGRIMDFLDDDTTLMVMSDHGFGNLVKDIYLNRFLIQTGFMKVKDRKWKKPFDMGNPFENIDWRKTTAYSHGLFGNVFINLQGREPAGIVSSGKQYEHVVESLMNQLLEIKDPEDKKKIVTRIYRKKEIYHGDYTKDAPDLLIEMRNYSYITRGGCEFIKNEFVSKPRINHSGNHRLNGIAFFRGPDIKKGFRIPDIHIVDLAPTILHIMDIPVSPDMDGRRVHEIFDSHQKQ